MVGMGDRVAETAEAITIKQAALRGILHPDYYVAAAFGKVGPGEPADSILARIAIFVEARQTRDLQPVEIVLQDDIDRASNRVRTIDRRATARDRFDPVDQPGRNQVEIDLRTGRRVTSRRRRPGGGPVGKKGVREGNTRRE